MSSLKVNTVQHNTSGFNNVVQFTDGSGTQNATLCRAWVNFRGTGTILIRASFNVSSVTDNGVGDYIVNLSNAMTDANYCVTIASNSTLTGGYPTPFIDNSYTTSSFRVIIGKNAISDDDSTIVNTAIFR